MAAQPLIEKSPLYYGIEINWKLASYLYKISSQFEPALLASDSDSYTVADSLASLFNLLLKLVLVNPGEFKDVHQELLMTVADYIFGADKTGRKPARGAWIRSRANPPALIGYSLEYLCRNLEFSSLRKFIKNAFNGGNITEKTHDSLLSFFETSSKEWRKTIEENLLKIGKQFWDDSLISSDPQPTQQTENLSPPPTQQSQDLFASNDQSQDLFPTVS